MSERPDHVSAAGPEGSWCERVAQAIVDGRFLESPGFWRPHVEACDVCRPSVEGLFALREAMADAALEVPADAPAGEDAWGRVGRAHAQRRQRAVRRGRALLGLGAFLLLGGGLVAWDLLHRRPQPGPASRTAAQAAEAQASEREWRAFAWALRERVLGSGRAGAARETLEADPALRAELEGLLDHPERVVRLTALSLLTTGGVAVPVERLERLMAGFATDIPGGVAVASADSGGSPDAIASALQAQHNLTLNNVLMASANLARQGKPSLCAAVILPYLSASDSGVSDAALEALAERRDYLPGEEVFQILERRGESVQARQLAAALIVDRLGWPGVKRMLEIVRRTGDGVPEAATAFQLLRLPEGLEHARRRIQEPDVPPYAGVVLLLRLADREPVSRPEGLVARLLAGTDSNNLYQLVSVARRAGWSDLRAPLEAAYLRNLPAWRASADPGVDFLLRALVRWDVELGTAEAVERALGLLEGYTPLRDGALDPTVLEFLRLQASAAEAARRRRAEALLQRLAPRGG